MRRPLVSDVEVVRAASLDGVPHGFLGRRGGVSTGVVAGPQRRLGQRRRPRGDRREPAARGRGRAARRRAGDRPPGPFADCRSGRAGAGRTTSGPMPMPWSPTGRACCSASSPPIARRCCSPTSKRESSARRMPAGAARSPASTRRRSRRWRSWARARERIAAAIGPAIAARNYEVDHGFRSAAGQLLPDNERFFADRTGRQAAFRPGGLYRSPAGGGRVKTSRRWASIPTPTPSASTATAAPPIAASRTTGARSA